MLVKTNNRLTNLGKLSGIVDQVFRGFWSKIGLGWIDFDCRLKKLLTGNFI